MLEWPLALLLILGSFIVLMAAGMPVAFAFILVNVVGAFLFFGGEAGLQQFCTNALGSLTSFVWLPIPLFILMGELAFQSGVATRAISALDIWLGRLPGRLSLLAVASGTLLSTLTGASMATTALLGTVLVPDMEKRGYKKPMTLGPILGSGGLSIMIPPSSLAIIVAALGKMSVAGILIGAIIPGLLMAAFYAAYIITRCQLQPYIAPPYQPPPAPLSKKVGSLVKHVLPLSIVIFMVTGVIFIGIATPSEAAATGALGALILAILYRGLSWATLKKIGWGTIHMTTMIFMIILGSQTFSQILAFSGASAGLAELVVGLPLPPIMLVIAMQLVLLFLGMFMGAVSMIMITIPIFMPIVHALGFNPLWFGLLMLLNMEMAETTPPFGFCLFTMKAVAPAGTTMGDIYRAGIPFLVCDAIVMALMIAFPQTVLWLPDLIR